MEAIVGIINNREEEMDEFSEKIEGSEKLRAEELAAETLDIQHDSKETSPLLRLPGELRNKIDDCVANVIRDEPSGKSIVTFHEYESLAQVNYKVRSEVHSFMPDRDEFHVKFADLDAFCQSFGNTNSNRTITLHVDVRGLTFEEDDDASRAKGGEDAASVAKILMPLCKDSKLQRIILKDPPGLMRSGPKQYYQYSMYIEAMGSQLRKEINVKTVGRDIIVKRGEHVDLLTARDNMLFGDYWEIIEEAEALRLDGKAQGPAEENYNWVD